MYLSIYIQDATTYMGLTQLTLSLMWSIKNNKENYKNCYYNLFKKIEYNKKISTKTLIKKTNKNNFFVFDLIYFYM